VSTITIGYRRADVAAFWILATATVGVALMLVAAALGGSKPWGWSGVAFAILLPRLVLRRWFETGIWVWNGVTRRLAVVLRAYALRVGYRLIAVVAGAGSDLELAPSAEPSRWIERRPPPARVEPDHWYGSLRDYARRAPGSWIFAILPMLLVLVVLRDEAVEATAPSHTAYTLF
jgi:hypothetical protein